MIEIRDQVIELVRHMVNPHKSKCERVSLGINFAIKGGIHDSVKIKTG